MPRLTVGHRAVGNPFEQMTRQNDLVEKAVGRLEDRLIVGRRSNAEKELISFIPQASIEQAQRTEVGGRPAYKIVHNNPITPENMWKTMNVIIVSNDMQYTLLFTTTNQDTYGKYVPVVDNMIKSIKIDDSKKC